MALGPLTFELSVDGAAAVRPSVDDFRLDEALDAPFVLQARLSVTADDVDTSAWVGRDAQLTLRRLPTERRVVGLVRWASDPEPHTDGAGGAWVDVEIVPALALLALRRNTRMFQQKTAPEILERVLGESLGAYGRSVELALDGAYDRREYCMQYQESDLAFVHRLMQEEGITYAFDHEGDVERMVLFDRNEAAERVPNLPAEGVLPYEPDSLVVTTTEPVHRFERDHGTTSTAVVGRDFDWSAGRIVVVVEAAGDDPLGRVRERYEHGEGRSFTIGSYDAGVRRYQRQDGARRVAIRREEHAAGALVGRGIGRAIGLAPGRRFRLAGHPGVGIDDEYLVVRVTHASVEAEELEGASGGEVYHNRFECVPLSVPHRPRRTVSKPRVMSVQTAVVTGPSGEEIHTDEWGRVKVRFHWDRDNPADETSSVWLRCRQEWTGAGFGWLWTPRIGQEVVVQFVDGDPDRPIAFGAVYDANALLPYDLPAEKTKSTFKSNSSRGGGGFNEIRFEDAAGREEYFFHSQKDTNEVILNNETITVGNNQTITIGSNQTQTIGANQTESVGANQTMDVGANRVVEVGATFTEEIAGTSTITVSGHATETLNAGETQTVNAGRTETVNGGETRTVNGGQTETINGGCTQTINGGATQTVSASVTETFSAAHTCTVTSTFAHTVGGSVTFTTPASYTLIAPAGYTNIAAGGQNIFAPGGYRVIAAAGQTWIGPIFIKLTGIDIDIEGAKAEIDTSIKASLTGVDVSILGAGIKLAAAIKCKNKPIDLWSHAVIAKTHPVYIEIAGTHISVSGIKLAV